MKKFMNTSEAFVDEALEGIVMAHHGKIGFAEDDRRVIVRKDQRAAGKTGIVTGGGFGHLPLFLGYVGYGLADSCAVGNVFSSPGSSQIYHAMKAANQGGGVLQLLGCYQGDKMNFKIARRMAEAEGIACRTVIVSDDVASAPPEQKSSRRGIAGIWFVYKIAGACAEAGRDLETVTRVAQKAADRVGSFGVSLSPCTIPAVGHPGFEIPEGQMEIGMGIHGEPGIEKSPLLSADETADRMIEEILKDQEISPGGNVAVLVNGLGATGLEELYILYRRIYQICREKEIRIAYNYVGEYATSFEMAGASVSLLKLDEELEDYLKSPCDSPLL